MRTKQHQSVVIILAGANGNLGQRIARALVDRGARVRALVRSRSSVPGVETVVVDYNNARALTEGCAGGTCVVSALAGLREVIVDAQSALLDAAVAAGVPRFIPSDFSIDFTHLTPGENRNLDLRREFHARIHDIAATTIFCGAFAELLNGEMPMVMKKVRRIVYWGDADQKLDFTTIDDTAAYTARAALDESTPRFLRIAGDSVSARDVANITGYKLFRAGPVKRLDRLSKIVRRLVPKEGELYPPWQGMQYGRDMASGRGKLAPLDNDRYPMRWTSVAEVLR